ncbi:polyprenyl synthetase family protein [Geoalkalibacter halelectricus]|uniref:Polyprenyl synthetase family protein n=1 Tax=Geoalkalibacter halelectricus TaxID=2847045 RepID=A0ABY5ZPD4_9BACT|nr:polyprenyl synthetase family protein [Geoalkalibacter halelectricus]MDO3379257.1 polyprenyl synthetase family protein [Geoalkalibacter halelectricus]UWZ81015.1 polyprenyl synthetase family protein [Geoalkalibacter halelectricus]
MENALKLLSDDLKKVEGQFKEFLDSDVYLVRKVGEYVIASGGKRMRPMLLLLCARLCGYSGDKHVGLGAVVEFLHTATLLHDDVVDDAVLRRGNASANTLWGNQASVLVGDFLLAKSFSIMVRGGNLDILQVLSDATTRMSEGEIMQLIGTCDLSMDEDRYLDVVRSKTAVLISAACEVGGILGGVDAERRAALREFGMELGIAFQFMDDALDYVAEEAEFGKSRGHDLEEGKMTLPLIHALRQCSAEEHQRVEEIVEQDELSAEDLDFVCDLIERFGGIEHTRTRAQQLVEQAKERLSGFPATEARQALFELADYVVSRRK